MQSASSTNTGSLVKDSGGILAGLLLLLIADCLVIIGSFASGSAEAWVEHTYQVTELIHRVFSRLQDMESGQRGYVITGDPHYLEPYREAAESVDLDLGRLTRLTADNAGQTRRLTRLESLTVEKRHVLQETIDLRGSRGFEAAARVVRTDRGKEIMDSIRAVVAELNGEESRLLAERQAVSNQWRWWLMISAVVGCTLGVLMIAWASANALRTHRTMLAANELLRANEGRLSASATRYRRLFEAARDGVLLLDLTTLKITDANPFMEELLGYSHEEFVGKELWEIGLFEYAEASRAALQRLKEMGYIRYEDLPLRSKTGQRIDIECVGNVSEKDGREVIQCNVRDITERKKAEAVQRDFRVLFESAPGLYLVLEPEEYRIVAVSDAYLSATMTGRETINGRRLFEVFPDDPAEPWADGVRKMRASLERVRTSRQADAMAVQRYPVPRPESLGGGFEERWWSSVNYPVVAPDGQLIFIIYRVEDVTPFILRLQTQGQGVDGLKLPEGQVQRLEAEIVLRGEDLQRANEHLRKSEALLQVANRELSDFAVIVSHDLKNPLRAVATLARWLETDYANKLDDEGRANLAEMVKRVGRMDRMIDGILAYSRLGRTEEGREPVALAALVPLVVQDLSPSTRVEIHIAAGLPLVYGEPVRLRQLFQNLIANAIKYGDKPQTEIRVDWTDAGERWQFSVADNGPGIEERHFERIFKIFQTLAPKDRTDSTGVGLALVKRIVERGGGRVWVESRMGEGSVFHFTWPKGEVRNDHPDSSAPAEDLACAANEGGRA